MEPEKSKAALKKIATLVKQQESTLKEAGVDVPSTSTQKSKVKGALPSGHVPALPDNTLDCPLCGKSFQNKSKLKDHYVVHTYKSKWVCVTCEIPFTSKTGMENHEKLHTKFKCQRNHGVGGSQSCQIYYDTLAALKVHMNIDIGYAGLPDDQKCDLCAKPFKSRALMLKHRKHRCFHNDEVEIEYFHCQYCGSRYREKKYVNQHEKYNCPKGLKLPHPKPKKRKAGDDDEDDDDDDGGDD